MAHGLVLIQRCHSVAPTGLRPSVYAKWQGATRRSRRNSGGRFARLLIRVESPDASVLNIMALPESFWGAGGIRTHSSETFRDSCCSNLARAPFFALPYGPAEKAWSFSQMKTRLSASLPALRRGRARESAESHTPSPVCQ